MDLRTEEVGDDDARDIFFRRAILPITSRTMTVMYVSGPDLAGRNVAITAQNFIRRSFSELNPNWDGRRKDSIHLTVTFKQSCIVPDVRDGREGLSN